MITTTAHDPVQCLTCEKPAQDYSSFCLECDGEIVAKPPAKKWVRCVRCHTHEAMPGRKVCEECAD